MNVTVTLDDRKFATDMRRIMELTGQTLEQQVKEQQRNFLSDALAFTPPFGDKPLTESSGAQLKVGTKAVRRDITKRAFRPLTDINIYSGWKGKPVKGKRSKKKYSDLGLRLRKAVKEQNWRLAGELLREGKIKTIGVIAAPTKKLKNELRQPSSGRIQRRIAYLTATTNAHNKRFSADSEKHVGTAKSGWLRPVNKLIGGLSDRNKIFKRLGSWITRHSQQGYYAEDGIGTDKFGVTVGNTISYMQKMEPHITRRAWDSRVRNIEKQRRSVEAYFRKKANEDSLLRGSVR